MLDNYEILQNGLIRQKDFFNQKRIYDLDYIKNSYDKYNELSVYMSYLRLGYLLGSINKTPLSILDVGYGNGDFLKIAKSKIDNCFGFEVNDYPLPLGCIKTEDIYDQEYDVVCFFDVLEHFEDIYEIKKLKTNYIYISVPECHYFSDEWFLKWKHRRPDEHLWHFNLNSLSLFMSELGFELISSSNLEDTIRKSSDENSNILTAIFKKK